MNRIRLFNLSIFRLSLIYMTLFGVSVLMLLGFIYMRTAGFMESQTDETIETEGATLVEHYERFGLPGIVDAITFRVKNEVEGEKFYLLVDSQRKRVAGNLARWPAKADSDSEWLEVRLPLRSRLSPEAADGGLGIKADVRAGEPRSLRLLRYDLSDGYRLLVGRDISERRNLQRLIMDSLVWGILMTVVLGLVGGVLMSKGMLRRLDWINLTSRQIMLGDLKSRIPVQGTGDEFDQLAINLNNMLDTIVELMQGVRQLSDSIAHDMKSPLNRLRSRLEVTLIQPGDEETYRRAIEQTLEETDDILATFHNLLKIAQAEANLRREDMEKVDLVQLCADMAEFYQPLAEEKGMKIETDLGTVVNVQGNRHMLSQVLANLIDNAIKYSQENQRVFLRLRTTPLGTELEVADTGPGIPAKEREKVLTRFYRMPESRDKPGTGLGLSLVAAVCKLHLAKLRLLDNHPGLKVVITFPPV